MLARFSARSCRFMDAYKKGLNGKQAAWASKKFRGHRVLPESIFHDISEPNIVYSVATVQLGFCSVFFLAFLLQRMQ